MAYKVNRRQFIGNTLVATTAMATLPIGKVLGANERINMGFIGLGGRGSGHCGWFSRIKGVEVAGLAEPDKGRLAGNQKKYPNAKGYTDLRKLLENKDINAVAIATCNHWHCLSAVWAVESGKDVYVEKPMGHNNFEELQLVAAARKHNKIVQLGTQQRSDPVQAEIKDFIHNKKELGAIKYIRANRYGIRGAIGKRTTPLKIDANVDYNLWLGPAEDKPIFRNKLQYDWHWDFNTGNGEMGNWGVHILDDVRNTGILDYGGLPKRILAGGGRIAYNDAGDTPNVHFVYYDTGKVPVIFDLSNVSLEPGKNRAPAYMGSRSGYTIHCEGGRYTGQRGGGKAYDNDNKMIKQFKGDGGGKHAQNFIDAVRSRDRNSLNAEVELGHHSSAWCNLANVAYQVGGKFSRENALEINKSHKGWSDLLDGANELLSKHGIKMDSDQIKLSPILEIDREKEVFVGKMASKANPFLTRKFRNKEFNYSSKA